jgi:hypothetical protein
MTPLSCMSAQFCPSPLINQQRGSGCLHTGKQEETAGVGNKTRARDQFLAPNLLWCRILRD